MIYEKNLGLFQISLAKFLGQIVEIIDLTAQAFSGGKKSVTSYDDYESQAICANVVVRIFTLPLYDEIEDAFVKLAFDLNKDHINRLSQVWSDPARNVALLVITVLFWEGGLH